MARRLAIWAGLFLLACAPGASATKPPVVSRTIGGAGVAVPRSFAGFSIEYGSVPDYFGRPGRPNEPFISLLRTLGAESVGAPTIRIGGNSADETWWNPSAKPRPQGVRTNLTPDWLRMLKAVNEGAGSRFVLGGNLAISDPANAVSYVRSAAAALAPGAIEAYEIGNEPDLYDRPIKFKVDRTTIKRIQHRPTGYDMRKYLADLDGYVAALNAARQPGWPALAVGGFAQRAWQVRAPGVLAHVGPAARFFETHTYPLSRCRSSRVDADRWRRQLLRAVGSPARLSRLVPKLRPAGAAVRLAETNSVSCGGAPRVSDSFAAALWGADTLFADAEAGLAGVNFHTWSGAWYAPIAFTAGVARVRPLLYGMLLFDRAVPQGARLLHVRQRRTDVVKVWATTDSTGTVRVVVIDKDPDKAHGVRLKLPPGLRSGTMERLLAPTLASRSGVTLGGRTFGGGAFDGTLHGRSRTTEVKIRGRVASLRVSASSAALVTFRR